MYQIKKERKNENNLGDSCGAIKEVNIYFSGISESEGEKEVAESLLKGLLAANFSKLGKDTDIIVPEKVHKRPIDRIIKGPTGAYHSQIVQSTRQNYKNCRRKTPSHISGDFN